MKIRMQRGGLKESMETVENLEPTREAILQYLRMNSSMPKGYFDDVELKVKDYGAGVDTRIGWHTHIVTIDGKAMAYTDGPLED